jgi:hypothetical protein
MSRALSLVLFVFLLLLLIGSLPAWPYSTGWGYYPSGGFGLLLLILIIVLIASPGLPRRPA